MDIKKIIKYIALILCMILLIILCILLVNFNRVTKEQIKTPAQVEMPEIKISEPKIVQPAIKENIIQEEIEKEVKPLMRDENNMPKSDFNVPEIG